MKYLLLIGCLALPVQFATAENNPAANAAAGGGFSGKVVETMTTAGYTYVLLDTGSKKIWAAAPQFAVKVGDAASFSSGEPMEKYHSKSLNRDFDAVYFTGSIVVNGGAAADKSETPKLPPGHPALPGAKAATLPPGHPSINGAAASPAGKVDLTGIKQADGGKTILEIFAAQAGLAGKSVTVRGKVVKYNAEIMGKNWLHIQDGTGTDDKGNNDLTVTTSATAKVGDTVLVIGKLAANKDFGAGYKYTAIIEDAKVTVE